MDHTGNRSSANLEPSTLAVLGGLLLNIFVFALGAGVVVFVGYGVAFLTSFDRSKGGVQGPPTRTALVAPIMLLAMLYVACIGGVLAFRESYDEPFSFLIGVGAGVATFATIVLAVLLAVGLWIVLWQVVSKTITGLMWKLTNASRSKYGIVDVAEEGGAERDDSRRDGDEAGVALMDMHDESHGENQA